LEFSPSLRDLIARDIFLKYFAFYLKPLNQNLEEIFWVWSTPCFSSCGFLSLEIFLLGQQCHHAFRVVDFYPSSFSSGASSATMLFGAILLFELWISIPRIYTFRPAVLLVYLNIGFRFCG
jgi:hypothetical protein